MLPVMTHLSGMQDGPAAGQSVPHVHIHILPRRAGDFERNDQVYDAIEASSKQEASDRYYCSLYEM